MKVVDMTHVAQPVASVHSDRPNLFQTILALTKVRITFAVTLTTATGYFLSMHGWSRYMILPLLGTFLLASGSSALNEWQESHLDARMKRTRPRPIPAGHIDAGVALGLSIFLMLIGLYLLAANPVGSYELVVLGLAAVVWYNGIYTYLKRMTAFAVVPGSVIGAIPPVIGYVAGGGLWYDPLILMVASFFFIWQIPHFWLLVLMIGDQYRHAGLPTLSDVFDTPQLKRITLMWILATAASGLSFVLVSVEVLDLLLPLKAVVVAASIWLGVKGYQMATCKAPDRSTYRKAFMQINLYALSIMIVLSANALIRLSQV